MDWHRSWEPNITWTLTRRISCSCFAGNAVTALKGFCGKEQDFCSFINVSKTALLYGLVQRMKQLSSQNSSTGTWWPGWIHFPERYGKCIQTRCIKIFCAKQRNLSPVFYIWKCRTAFPQNHRNGTLRPVPRLPKRSSPLWKLYSSIPPRACCAALCGRKMPNLCRRWIRNTLLMPV